MMPFATGANQSPYDSRTWQHNTGDFAGEPLVKGGVSYLPEDILHQHHVGKCTAISLVQNANKATGKKFSDDFQYLIQKKFYDLNWTEGSSIFNALRAAKNIGFLPAELWTHTTEADSFLPYPQYIAKLQAISEAEIARLCALCTVKLAGYASVPVDVQSLAKAILDSKSGILTRYEVGKEWYTAKDGHSSYDPKDIDPLRAPEEVISGHAIVKSMFDFSTNLTFELANTWGISWNDKGRGHTNFTYYRCTEAWIPYYDIVPQPAPAPFIFTQDMHFGQTSNDIIQLQKRLKVTPTSGYYGSLTRMAVYQYQLQHVQMRWYDTLLRGSICGPKTRASLNANP